MAIYRKTFILSLVFLLHFAFLAHAADVRTDNIDVRVAGDYLNVSADIILDGLKVKSNGQIFITPLIKGSGEEVLQLPSVLVNGRNMHISYQRGALKGFPAIKNHKIGQEVKRENGRRQTINYITRIPLELWMRGEETRVLFTLDSCGCGATLGRTITEETPLEINPAKHMRTTMATPVVKELPIETHEGRARVQFEVDGTVLHATPYTCRNGQVIDNRQQLKIIDDSIAVALRDPNVEIAQIAICGSASPESPYLHNEELATARSRALAEYLADRYNLPHEQTSYSSIPENWKEFRRMVLESKEITGKQRADLLELIDRPAYGSSDYDAKEKELLTSPKFAKLYKNVILPKWFPELRSTTFYISTRLRPMGDQQLAKVMATTPEKMSLNQMFRVARLYPEGSDEFNRIIDTALKFYPDDPTANLNAAAAEVARGNYDKAKELLKKAGDSPEAINLRGIIATHEWDFEKAADYFEKAGNLPEASKNINLIK